MRKKLSDDEKKKKISVSINDDLLILLEEHIENMNVNRSRYIENLIRKDFEQRKMDEK